MDSVASRGLRDAVNLLILFDGTHMVATGLVMMVRIPLPKIDACIDTIIDGFLAQNLCIVSFCIVHM